MAKAILLTLLFIVPALQTDAKTRRYKGHVLECLSGDCVNGTGVATVSMNSEYENDLRNQLHYAGSFKDGLMDGDGRAYKTHSSIYISGEKPQLYTGHFEGGDMDGYMVIWRAKAEVAAMVPDSSEAVCFVRYDRGIVDEMIEVVSDGTTVNYFGSKDYVNGRSDTKRKIKDGHLKELAAGFIASRQGRFNTGPSARPAILAVKNVNAARGRQARFTDWECLTDRNYFVTATALTAHRQMPFGGRVTYQAVSPEGTVVFEAPVDTYFTPPKPGKYSFQVVFDQNVIGGGNGVVVDGVQLELSLRSRSLF